MNGLHLRKPSTLKIIKPVLLLLTLFLSVYSNAVVAPVTHAPAHFDPFKIKARDIERITGKKLTLFQKLKLAIAQNVLRKYSHGQMTAKQEKQARTSMILAFLGLALLLLAFVPALGVLALFSILASTLAIIFGAKSLKGNGNRQGKIGVIVGGLTIVFILLVMALVALTLSA